MLAVFRLCDHAAAVVEFFDTALGGEFPKAAIRDASEVVWVETTPRDHRGGGKPFLRFADGIDAESFQTAERLALCDRWPSRSAMDRAIAKAHGEGNIGQELAGRTVEILAERLLIRERLLDPEPQRQLLRNVMAESLEAPEYLRSDIVKAATRVADMLDRLGDRPRRCLNPHETMWRKFEEGPVLERKEWEAERPELVRSIKVLRRFDEPIAETTTQTVCDHNNDFSICIWHNKKHHFSGMQADIVARLWPWWEKHPGLGLHQTTIYTELTSITLERNRQSFRVANYFREHEAWGTMIHTDRQGKFWLGPPPEPPEKPKNGARRKTAKRPRKKSTAFRR